MTSRKPEHLAAFVELLTREMLAFCGPIFITPGVRTYPEQMIDNGTYSLIDTGEKRVLVTCHHVWQAYLDSRAENPDAVLCLNLGDGDATIAFARPEGQLVDADAGLDLAVFDFEPEHLRVKNAQVNHGKEWFPIRCWPIVKVGEGETVVLMGFPGKRIRKEGILCTFSAQPLPLKVTGVGKNEIYIFNVGENIQVFNDTKGRLGGLSGSPAYTIDEAGASLVGFVKSGFKRAAEEADAAPDSIFAGSLTLTHASFLQRNGTLARP